MEPNDTYLYIVAAHVKADRSGTIYLALEDDHRIAVILSKTLRLADDTKIKDPTILR